MYSFKNKNIYRDTLPSGSYDLVIVSLIHQGPEMVYYMSKNIEKYVNGSFIWVAHYNNEIQFDENSLPPWAWLVRDTMQTTPYSRSKTFGIMKAIDFAIVNLDKFTNCMTLSSGSAFFRKLDVPTVPTICLYEYTKHIDPSCILTHCEEIGIEHAGMCSQYLVSKKHFAWQYEGCDSDIEFHSLMKSRMFKCFKGAQWPGQVWPYEVAYMLSKDIGSLYESCKMKTQPYYAAEEIILSTYAYNYAKKHSIPVQLSECIINWSTGYYISNIEQVKYLRAKYSESGHALCKLSDDVIHDPVRQYLINDV